MENQNQNFSFYLQGSSDVTGQNHYSAELPDRPLVVRLFFCRQKAGFWSTGSILKVK
jgi:hypothetical protein